MKIVCNWSDDGEWGVVPYMHKSLEIFNDDNSNEVLMNGAAWIYHHEIKEQFKDYNRRCLLALWSPCEFTSRVDYYHFDHYDFFTDVYCVCPFTCKFMNDHYGYEKFKYIPYPYTNYSVKEFGNYDADCSWMGSIHGEDHILGVETMMNFKYKFITPQRNTWMRHPYEFNNCTHVLLPNDEKLIELSKAKCSLSFNMIYMSPTSQRNNIQAFERFDEGIMPQFKVRNHEIASSKSLLLVKKDSWNLIEDFYTPEEEFIYFENFNQLKAIIQDVSTNFDKYEDIIEAAYLRSKNYTVEKIYQYIKTDDNSLITWRNKHAC
tara:strand:+ start:224 stop:1180 length:957 start_codon:yes stop_codon:yes gene_type:complete